VFVHSLTIGDHHRANDNQRRYGMAANTSWMTVLPLLGRGSLHIVEPEFPICLWVNIIAVLIDVYSVHFVERMNACA
jgi:hypothetical protein